MVVLLTKAGLKDLSNIDDLETDLETCELVVFDATAVGTEKDGMLNGQS